MIGSVPVKAIDDRDGCQTRFSWLILMKTPLLIKGYLVDLFRRRKAFFVIFFKKLLTRVYTLMHSAPYAADYPRLHYLCIESWI